MAKLVSTEGGSNKFWEGETTGAELSTRWGAVGTKGQAKTESFPSAAAATAVLEKKIKEKRGKGYVDAGVDPPAAASAPSAAPPIEAPAADSLLAQVIAKLRKSGGGTGFGCDEYEKPVPLPAAALAALTLPGGAPLSPSLCAWLSFAGTWSLPVLSKNGLQHERVSAIVARIFDVEIGDAEEYFDGLDVEYPAGGFVLPQSAKQAHILYLGVTDEAGEHPVLGVELGEDSWVKYPSFPAYLADYFGVLSTKKQPGFAAAVKAQTARLATASAAAKKASAAKPKRERVVNDDKLETPLPPVTGAAADAIAALVAILRDAPPLALDAAIPRSPAMVRNAKGVFVSLREVLPTGAAVNAALAGEMPCPRGSHWRTTLPMELAPLVDAARAEIPLTSLATDKTLPPEIRGPALTSLGYCPTSGAVAVLADVLFTPVVAIPPTNRRDLRLVSGAGGGLRARRTPGVVDDWLRILDRWSRDPAAAYQIGEELLSCFRARKIAFTDPNAIAICLRATSRTDAWLGWRFLHTLALPHIGEGMPEDLRALIQAENDASLQPRMEEVARAFGVDPKAV